MTKESETIKQQLAKFGRSFALVFNRSFMYSTDHPFQTEAFNSTYQILTDLLQNISPTVFILNGERFFVDEEPLDPRLNVSKIVAHFKKTGMESISFYGGVQKRELQLLLEIAASLDKLSNAETMSKEMFKKGINHIKINHFFYKKVSAEDEVISRNFLDKVTPEMMGEHNVEVKQMFMDAVFSNVLQEEFIEKLNLSNLLANPGELSKEMIAADLTTVKNYNNINTDGIKNLGEAKNEELSPGQFLLHQLVVLDQDVENSLSEEKEVNLAKIVEALSDMRQKLIEGIEAQKALGTAYANEKELISKSTELSDKVLIRLIKEEYKGGEISVSRLAHILCRLIPEADELKRLLPKIKSTLLEEGMSQTDFMSLIQELGKELQSDGLINILSESAEEIGIDGDDIIQKIKEDPLHSAEMIYLASEIRKSGGDEKTLTDLIVNYVEQVGSKYSQDLTGKKGEKGEKHIQRALVKVKSNLVQQLGNLDIKDDLLNRLEENVNQRMDEVFNKLRSEWLKSQSASPEQEFHKELTVLKTLERGVNENEEMGQILKVIRGKVVSGEIDENDFEQIYQEIVRQEQLRKSENDQKGLPIGFMREKMLMTFMDKEITRARRYKTSLSVLGLALLKIKAKTNLRPDQINKREIINALLHKLVEIFRTPDILGEMGKNQFIALLPMAHQGQANLALRRVMKLLHLTPLDVGGVAYEIKVAGVAVDINSEDITSAESLVTNLKSQLKERAKRLGTLHAYS